MISFLGDLFRKQLVGNTQRNRGEGLQLPLGIYITPIVLAFLAILAVACHCLTEAWKSNCRARCQARRSPGPGEGLQLVLTHSPGEPFKRLQVTEVPSLAGDEAECDFYGCQEGNPANHHVSLGEDPRLR